MRYTILLGALLAAAPALAGVKTGSGTVPDRTPAQVLKALARHCIKGGSTVESLTENGLVCSAAMTGMRGFAVQALLGNQYSTAPITRVRFTAIEDGTGTLVQFSGAVEMVSAFGKPIVNPMDVKPADVSTILAAAADLPAAAPPPPPAAPLTPEQERAKYPQLFEPIGPKHDAPKG